MLTLPFISILSETISIGPVLRNISFLLKAVWAHTQVCIVNRIKKTTRYIFFTLMNFPNQLILALTPEESVSSPLFIKMDRPTPVSYTHLRAHETDSYLVCRL